MTRKIRIGLISTSWWAEMIHIPSVKSHPSGEISAICGRDLKKLELIAAKYGIKRIYTDYQEMIHKGDIDAVIVASPDDMHYPMVLEALDAGRHVLCEKPLANNLKQAKEMLERAERAGVIHMLLFTWRWMPAYVYIRELISKGYIGELFQSYMNFYVGSGRNLQTYKWQYDSNRSLGIIGGLGSHMFDLSRFFIGDISAVFSHLSTFSIQSNPEFKSPTNDTANVCVTFKNQSQGMIQLSGIAFVGDRHFEQRVVLHGTHGTIEADLFFSGHQQGIRLKGGRDRDARIMDLSIPNRLMNSAGDKNLMEPFMKQSAGPRLFIDAILQNKKVPPDFHDGVEVQKIIDACQKSDKSGIWVSVN